MTPWKRALGLSATMLLSGCGLRHAPPPDVPYTFTLQPSTELVERQSWGRYTVEIYGTEDARFVIYRKGKEVYSRGGTFFQVGYFSMPEARSVVLPMGTDMTGDGIPNLMVYERADVLAGGRRFHIFEIGRRFRFLQRIGRGGRTWDYFPDLTGDGALEFVTGDSSYGQLAQSMANMPRPKMIYAFRDGKYRPAVDLMREPPPSAADLAWMAQKTRECLAKPMVVPTPTCLWVKVLNLTYAGNLGSALELLETGVPDSFEGDHPTLDELFYALDQSPYRDHIYAANGLEP